MSRTRSCKYFSLIVSCLDYGKISNSLISVLRTPKLEPKVIVTPKSIGSVLKEKKDKHNFLLDFGSPSVPAP